MSTDCINSYQPKTCTGSDDQTSGSDNNSSNQSTDSSNDTIFNQSTDAGNSDQSQGASSDDSSDTSNSKPSGSSNTKSSKLNNNKQSKSSDKGLFNKQSGLNDNCDKCCCCCLSPSNDDSQTNDVNNNNCNNKSDNCCCCSSSNDDFGNIFGEGGLSSFMNDFFKDDDDIGDNDSPTNDNNNCCCHCCHCCDNDPSADNIDKPDGGSNIPSTKNKNNPDAGSNIPSTKNKNNPDAGSNIPSTKNKNNFGSGSNIPSTKNKNNLGGGNNIPPTKNGGGSSINKGSTSPSTSGKMQRSNYLPTQYNGRHLYVSPNGSIKTIQDAANQVRPGDTVHVADGNYQGGIRTTTPGVHYISDNGGAKIVGNSNQIGIGWDNWGDNVAIDGFEVDGKGSNFGIGIRTKGNNSVVENCNVHDILQNTPQMRINSNNGQGGAGIEFAKCQNAAILNNHVHHIGQGDGNKLIHGIYAAGQGTIAGNYVDHVGMNGINSGHAATRLDIHNNFISKAGKGGIKLGAGEVGTVPGGNNNSIVHDNDVEDCDLAYYTWGSVGSNNKFYGNRSRHVGKEYAGIPERNIRR